MILKKRYLGQVYWVLFFCKTWRKKTYYVHMRINYECSLVHPYFWIHKLPIQNYFDTTCKWSCPRQCICKLSIKSYLWHAVLKMVSHVVLIKTNEPKDIDSDINRSTDTLFWINNTLSVTQWAFSLRLFIWPWR